MQFAGKLWMDVKFLDSSVFKKESKLIFGFPDIPTFHHMKIYCSISYVRKHLIAAYLWSVLLIFTSIYTINRGTCPRPCVRQSRVRWNRLASQGPRLAVGHVAAALRAKARGLPRESRVYVVAKPRII